MSCENYRSRSVRPWRIPPRRASAAGGSPSVGVWRRQGRQEREEK
ncbi:hypothetical protein [Brasilonema sennae]|nr:hypothetical protein [Brasilonema sennae]